jgi:hypothetical protein
MCRQISASISRVAQSTRAFNLCMNIMSLIGIYSFVSSHTSCRYNLLGIARRKTSCLTRRGCILSHSTPWTSGVARTIEETRKNTQGLGVLHDTFLSTSAFRGSITQLMVLLLTNPSVAATSQHLSTKTKRRLAIHSRLTYTISGT